MAKEMPKRQDKMKTPPTIAPSISFVDSLSWEKRKDMIRRRVAPHMDKNRYCDTFLTSFK
ncbi:MAG: hypothetical protein JSW28_10690 [Thermoplasmata archaeon]|nr:MAG: hypothetical protein JSW28_10690 [Thermoplasmata archaeon]